MDNRAKQVERKFRRYELPLLIGLVILWLALWGSLSPLIFVSGIIVAILTTRFLYLPPVEIAPTFNLYYFVRYAVHFLWNVAKASVHVAWLAVRPVRVPNCSIILIQLKTTSDFIMTATGLTISLIPGSFIVEADRQNHILYLHVLGAKSEAEIAAMRQDVAQVERLLIKAVGNAEDREKYD